MRKTVLTLLAMAITLVSVTFVGGCGGAKDLRSVSQPTSLQPEALRAKPSPDISFEITSEGSPQAGKTFKLTVKAIPLSDLRGGQVDIKVVLPSTLAVVNGQLQWTGQVSAGKTVELSANLQSLVGDSHQIAVFAEVPKVSTFAKYVLVTPQGVQDAPEPSGPGKPEDESKKRDVPAKQ